MPASSTKPEGRTAYETLDCRTSALGLPRQTFGGQDLYPGGAEKVTALGYSLILNHPVVDGKKRIGHASLESMLMLNGLELSASVDDAEAEVLAVAAGQLTREQFQDWVTGHVIDRESQRG